MSKKTYLLMIFTIIVTGISLCIYLNRMDKEELYNNMCEKPLYNIERKDNVEEAIKNLQIVDNYLETKMIIQNNEIIKRESERKQFELFYNTIKNTKERLEYSYNNESTKEQYRELMRTKITIGKCSVPKGIQLYPDAILYRIIEILGYVITIIMWTLLLYSANKDSKLYE